MKSQIYMIKITFIGIFPANYFADCVYIIWKISNIKFFLSYFISLTVIILINWLISIICIILLFLILYLKLRVGPGGERIPPTLSVLILHLKVNFDPITVFCENSLLVSVKKNLYKIYLKVHFLTIFQLFVQKS
jgi:hypothetical protein